MFLTDEQKLAIKDGVKEGFEKNGYALSIRDNFIIGLSVDTTIDATERVLYEMLKGVKQ